MSTVSVVVVWDALLVVALIAAIIWRKELLRWVTGADRQPGSGWDATEDEEEWNAFLADHPELSSANSLKLQRRPHRQR